MLASLEIKNVALIESLQINFSNNLNVITGETGSGKSIMLNALGFVIGDRLDKSLIRAGADFMKVDAIFSNLNEKVVDILNTKFDLGIEQDKLLISREYTISGKTYCKVNGKLVTTTQLRDISAILIDIHGQHQHQSLLNREYQLQILDNFCGENLRSKLDTLNQYIDNINLIDKQIDALGGNVEQKQNLIDLYTYQMQEIENAKIKDGEFEELTERYKELKNSEKISQKLNDCLGLLDKNAFSQSANEQIFQAEKDLFSLNEMGEKYLKIGERLESVNIELQDIISELYNLSNGINFDENEFENLDLRIDFIKNLFRKYGGNYESLLKYYDDIKIKLHNLLNSEEEYNRLSKEKEDVLEKIDNLQHEISKIRQANALSMAEKIEDELKNLGMKNAKFLIKFERINEEYSRSGFDFIDFMFSANLGFEPKPLNKIASGGELSRFMLAYKIVANELDNIGCMIFDEIDTGISGNTANIVANCMGKLSKNKQLIVVTHLPQITAMADTNFMVEKYTDTTTHTSMKEIKEKDLMKEIARLMGLLGEEGFEFAQKLKITANEFKKSLNI